MPKVTFTINSFSPILQTYKPRPKKFKKGTFVVTKGIGICTSFPDDKILHCLQNQVLGVSQGISFPPPWATAGCRHTSPLSGHQLQALSVSGVAVWSMQMSPHYSQLFQPCSKTFSIPPDLFAVQHHWTAHTWGCACMCTHTLTLRQAHMCTHAMLVHPRVTLVLWSALARFFFPSIWLVPFHAIVTSPFCSPSFHAPHQAWVRNPYSQMSCSQVSVISALNSDTWPKTLIWVF